MPIRRAPSCPAGRDLRPRGWLACLLAAWLLAGPAAGRAEEPAGKLSADELMQAALTRDEAERNARARWRHDQESTTERLDAQGQSLASTVTSRRGVVSDEAPGASGSVDAAPASEHRSDEDFSVALDLRKLAGRFDLAREPDQPSKDGERCYVISFRPRPDPPPAASREDKVINQLAGRFWLAQRDLSIVQSEGTLRQPVTVAWVASVYRLDFRYRGRRLPGRMLVVPASFTLDLGVSAPLYHSRQRRTTVMTNYQPGPDQDQR